jgi:hypothetical protein
MKANQIVVHGDATMGFHSCYDEGKMNAIKGAHDQDAHRTACYDQKGAQNRPFRAA